MAHGWPLLLSYGTEYAWQEPFGATAGGIAGLIIMFIIYIKHRSKIFEFQPIEQHKEEL